jgi:RHS repeat-associated protein
MRPILGWIRSAAMVGLACLGAATAEPQPVEVPCPTSSPVCWDIGTGAYCARPPNWIWPSGFCDCGTDRLFSRQCGMGYGGGDGGCCAACAYTPIYGTPCVDVEYPLDDESPGGGPGGPSPPQPPQARGCPVSLTTGQVFFTHTDAVVGEVEVSRTYDTIRLTPGRYASFGPGWNGSLESRLRFLSANIVEARLESGRAVYYVDENADGVFEAQLPPSTTSRLQTEPGGGYRRVLRAGGYELYDASGLVLSVADAAGVATTYTRDGQGRITSVMRLGRGVSFSYSGDSPQPQQLLGPESAVLATYTYAASGALETVTYPDGGGYRYMYDTAGRVVVVTDLEHRPLEAHEYDAQGRALTSEIAGGREKLDFAYASSKTTVTDALGSATEYDFQNVHGMLRVTKVTGPCSSCGGGGGDVQEWGYDALGQITSFKNGAGKTWTYTYSPEGNLLTETDPLTQETTYTYDAEGRVLTRTGPDGAVTTYTHAPAGPLTVTESVTAGQTRTTTMSYTALGRVETVTDARGKTTQIGYTTQGEFETVTDPLSHSTTFAYDAFGRRTSVTDALSHSTTTAYDARGRVSRVTSHDGTHTDFSYDTLGRRTSVTDPMGRRTVYVYDRYGRLERLIDPAGGQTIYGYDLMSNLVSLKDAKGQTTAFEYDGHNRVKKTIYPGGAFESFAYDAAGRLFTKTDRKGVVTTFAYDELGRLTSKTYSDTTPAVSYSYDPAGRLLTAANGTDTLTWTYDLAGQVLTEASTKNASTVAYAYDSGGNRLSVSLNGEVFVTYAYDDASRLTTITRGANVFGFGYDEANRRTSMTYPNGVNTSYTYDTLNRLLNLSAVHVPTATSITNFTYTYDASGNRTKKQQLDYTEDYGYDALYRLTGVERTGAGGGRQLFGYDAVGNRLTHQKDGVVTTSSYNERNQLLTTTGGGTMRWRGQIDEPGTVTFTSALVNGKPARMLQGNVFEAELEMAAGANTVSVQATDASGNVTTRSYQVHVPAAGASYGYDANGNSTGKVEGTDTWTYAWNAENQLTKVEKNGAEVARFAYDPLGRRVEKVAGGLTTGHTYDGENILREISGTTTMKYVQGRGLDEPLAGDHGGGLTYIHADGLGSIVKVTDAVGAVTLARRYDASGNPELGMSNAGYAFTGREWDPETALHHYRARYYDPALGRFLSEDPSGLRGGVNRYPYVAGNPANWTDPSGRVIISHRSTTRHMEPSSVVVPHCEGHLGCTDTVGGITHECYENKDCCWRTEFTIRISIDMWVSDDLGWKTPVVKAHEEGHVAISEDWFWESVRLAGSFERVQFASKRECDRRSTAFEISQMMLLHLRQFFYEYVF